MAVSAAAGTAVVMGLMIVVGVVGGAAAVPAVYAFGDSLVDAGNNNHLPLSLLKADFPHNGVDFPGHRPTGRFSNGKNFPDFLAATLGLTAAPPYLSLRSGTNNAAAYMAGVNFASGGAGISDSTNSGQCISFGSQIDYFSSVYGSLVQQLGQPAAAAHLAASVFAVVVGSNDIIAYVKSSPGDPLAAPAAQFVASLALAFQDKLQRLYNLGGRKFVVVGTGPIGCTPALREQTGGKQCNDEANSLSAQFSAAAAAALRAIAAKLGDFRYSFFDSSPVIMQYIQQPAAYGFVETKAACCGLGDLNAKIACTPVSALCANRSSYLFWDLYHPTEAVARMLTAAAFDGVPPVVSPVNIRQLSGL